MRILFLSQWFPYPADNGSKLRTLNLLRGLAQRHEVTLLSFTDKAEAVTSVETEAPELRTICREVHAVARKPFDARRNRAPWAFLSLTPRSMVDTYSTEMEQRIEQTLASAAYDAVIAGELGTAVYWRKFRQLPALLDDIELGVLYEQFSRATTAWRRLRYGLTWAKHCRYMARLLHHFGACTVVSARERELMLQAAPAYSAVEVIPNGVNLADYRDVYGAPQLGSMIFSGSFTYSANYDAMTWFLTDVYPKIQAKLPTVHLTITGNHANRSLPGASNVALTGFVDDVRPFIASAWLSLAPIRIGAGTRLKILEAMALRTPVVSTTKGAEGLEVVHDQHLLMADTPDAFAEKIIHLMMDSGLRQRLADNAYQLVQQRYDWAVIMPRFLELVERIAPGPSSMTRVHGSLSSSTM